MISAIETINLLSSSLDTHPHDDTRPHSLLHIFPIVGLGGISSARQSYVPTNCSRPSRLNVAMGMTFNVVARLAMVVIIFGAANVSRHQLIPIVSKPLCTGSPQFLSPSSKPMMLSLGGLLGNVSCKNTGGTSENPESGSVTSTEPSASEVC